MILLLTLFFLILTPTFSQNRVIEITTSNIQLVLRTVDRLHLLLHDPNCQHSRQYSQKFLQVKTPLQLGIADCQREKELCKHLNVTHFPMLLQLTNSTMTILDEQQFLVADGMVQQNDPKVMVNAIVGRLKGEKGWTAIVLEEEGLPVLQRIQNAEELGVFYLQPPSRLYDHLSAMVGRRIGCWILDRREGGIEKYYCGSGYKSEELGKYLQNFSKGKLVKHTFSRQPNATHLTHNELAQILKQNYSVKKCKLVYFTSKLCEHCSAQDVKRIEDTVAELKLKDKFQVQLYDLDQEEVPAGFALRRVPQLVELCNFERKDFGDVFTLAALSKFLGRAKTTRKIGRPDIPSYEPREASIESKGPAAEEKLEL